MVERQLPKLHTGVRFPSPAICPIKSPLKYRLSHNTSIKDRQFPLTCFFSLSDARVVEMRAVNPRIVQQPISPQTVDSSS